MMYIYVGLLVEVIVYMFDEFVCNLIIMGMYGCSGVVGLVMGFVVICVFYLVSVLVLLVK